MARFAIAVDLGSSGFRAQSLDLASGEVLSTAITKHHPLPGTNVIDHIHFALEIGEPAASRRIREAVNRVIQQLHICTADVARVALCGNPAQLSLFQNMEIRDLAFPGSRHLNALGVSIPDRRAAICWAEQFPGLDLPDRCEVVIPPAVRHEIGADTLALILQSGILFQEQPAIAIDYGTNAEMALTCNGHIFTGSAAAGAALEGRHITCGSVAIPGAIADVEATEGGHLLVVLDHAMLPVAGDLIDLRQALSVEHSTPAKYVTGTGTIAAFEQAIESGLIELPHICTSDRRLHLGSSICLTEADLAEAGKAIGAIRAGYFTLSVEAGISPVAIRTAYLAGASGTYMSARKAMHLGLIPPKVESIHHLGNTSLAMARELALQPEKLDVMSGLAARLRQTHCIFAQSKTFSRVFLLELSHWTEGMPMPLYRQFLHKYCLPDLPVSYSQPQIVHHVQRDIEPLGRQGLAIVDPVGPLLAHKMRDCTGCGMCVAECPAQALSLQDDLRTIALDLPVCRGVACRHCEQICPEAAFALRAFFEPADFGRKVEDEHTAVRG